MQSVVCHRRRRLWRSCKGNAPSSRWQSTFSTEAYDRGKKFEFYRTIDSLKEYVLVDQSRMYVERHRPLGLGRWEMTAFTAPEDVLSLESVVGELTLAAIYDGVELES